MWQNFLISHFQTLISYHFYSTYFLTFMEVFFLKNSDFGIFCERTCFLYHNFRTFYQMKTAFWKMTLKQFHHKFLKDSLTSFCFQFFITLFTWLCTLEAARWRRVSDIFTSLVSSPGSQLVPSKDLFSAVPRLIKPINACHVIVLYFLLR